MKLRNVARCVSFACALLWPAAAFAQGSEKLSAQANDAYAQKQYDKSAQLYAEAFEQGERRAVVLYNAASSAALAGRKDEAFKYLEEAAARGFHDAAQMEKDADLVSLRADPRWQAALKRAQSNAALNKALWESTALRTPYSANLTDEEKVAGLSKLWSEAKFGFVNFDLVPGLDWDAQYLAFLPRVRQTKGTLEYYRVLEEFMAKLRDSHTNITFPKELFDEVYARAPLRTRLVEDKVLVTRVLDEKLKAEGVMAGLEVVAVDGVPVRQYAEERLMPHISASTRQDMEVRAYDYGLLRGSSKSPVELTFRDAGGREFKRSLPHLTGAEWQKLGAPMAPAFEYKVLPGNVAYVALNTFNLEDVPKQFEANFEKIAQSDALILDVRENDGGNSSNGWRVLAHLTDRPQTVTRWHTRNYRPTYRAWGRMHDAYFYGESSFEPAKVAKHYDRPVVVLTSPRTFSAAEDFASAFDVMRRGLIVGEPTGGSTGQPLFFWLPGGGNSRVTSKRDTYPDGTEFVGVGVQPDRLVRPTVADFRAGRDTVLEAAREVVREMLKK